MTSAKADWAYIEQTPDFLIHLERHLSKCPVSVHANHINKLLQSAGHRVALTGGALENPDITPNDYDLVTTCPYEKIISILIAHGIEYSIKGEGKKRCITIQAPPNIRDGNTRPVDICSLDPDGNLGQTMSYQELLFHNSLNRNFARKSLYLDLRQRKIFDFHYGLMDIHHNLIRFVCDPLKKILEQPCRILQALQLSLDGKQWDPLTWQAIHLFHQSQGEIGVDPKWSQKYADLEALGYPVEDLLISTFAWLPGSFSATEPRAIAAFTQKPVTVSPIEPIEILKPLAESEPGPSGIKNKKENELFQTTINSNALPEHSKPVTPSLQSNTTLSSGHESIRTRKSQKQVAPSKAKTPSAESTNLDKVKKAESIKTTVAINSSGKQPIPSESFSSPISTPAQISFWATLGAKNQKKLLEIPKIVMLMQILEENNLLQQQIIQDLLMYPSSQDILFILKDHNLLNPKNWREILKYPELSDLLDLLKIMNKENTLYQSTLMHLLTYPLSSNTLKGYACIFNTDHASTLANYIEAAKSSVIHLQPLFILYHLHLLNKPNLLPCIINQKCFSDLPSADLFFMLSEFRSYLHTCEDKDGLLQVLAEDTAGYYLRAILLFLYQFKHSAIFKEYYFDTNTDIPPVVYHSKNQCLLMEQAAGSMQQLYEVKNKDNLKFLPRRRLLESLYDIGKAESGFEKIPYHMVLIGLNDILKKLIARESPKTFEQSLQGDVTKKAAFLIANYTYLKARELILTLNLSPLIMGHLMTRIHLKDSNNPLYTSRTIEILCLLYSNQVLNQNTINILILMNPTKLEALILSLREKKFNETYFIRMATELSLIGASFTLGPLLETQAALGLNSSVETVEVSSANNEHTFFSMDNSSGSPTSLPKIAPSQQ